MFPGAPVGTRLLVRPGAVRSPLCLLGAAAPSAFAGVSPGALLAASVLPSTGPSCGRDPRRSGCPPRRFGSFSEGVRRLRSGSMSTPTDRAASLPGPEHAAPGRRRCPAPARPSRSRFRARATPVWIRLRRPVRPTRGAVVRSTAAPREADGAGAAGPSSVGFVRIQLYCAIIFCFWKLPLGVKFLLRPPSARPAKPTTYTYGLACSRLPESIPPVQLVPPQISDVRRSAVPAQT